MDSNKPTLLIVEDDSDVRETIVDCLMDLNAELIQEENGKLGFEAAQKYRPQAILTDINMPVMNGLEMIRQLRAAGFENPIVILSAFGDKNNTVEALRVGANDFLTKPFDADQLVAVLEAQLKIGSELSEFDAEWKKIVEQSPDLARVDENMQAKKKEIFKMKWLSGKK